ncbi:MAG: hypothetical protein AB8B69_25170 [Chitinophagales bacterium]
MQNKLTTILDSFNVYEVNRFKKYLLSPFFNEDHKLVDLFDILILARKNSKKQIASKEEMWRKLGQKTVYKDVRFRRWCSDLTKLAMQFLAQERYQNAKMPEQQYLLEVVETRNLEKFYHSSFRNAENTLLKQKHRDSVFYYHHFKLNEAQQSIEFKTKGHSEQVSFDVLMRHLDAFYLAQKLRAYCHWLNYRKVLRLEGAMEVPLMSELMEFIEENKSNQVPIVAIYHQIALTLLKGEEAEHYYKLKRLLEEHSHLFSAEEAMEMYGYALNYCIRKINSSTEYLAEVFELYQVTLKKEVILNDGQLNHQHFKNVIAIGLRLKQFDWVMYFIEAYQSKLPEKVRDNAYRYNMAQVYFSKKEWGKVIELLQQVEYDLVFYKLDSKALLLKTYYEQGEWMVLESLIDSFQILLRRNKEVSKQQRNTYLNLVKFVKRLSRLMPDDAERIKVLKQKIESTHPVGDKGWLLEKLEEL